MLKRYLNFCIKFLIAALLIWALYKQLFARQDANEVIVIFKKSIASGNALWFLAALALVPVNWGIESFKWQKLMRPFMEMLFFKAYRAILAGVTISIFTPNRIGEYGGRILEVEAKYNWKGVLATLVGSFSQLLILLSFGLAGALFYLSKYENIDGFLLNSSIFIGGSLILFMLLAYFNVDMILPIVRRLPLGKWARPVFRQLVVLKSYKAKRLGQVLFLSMLRYLVYSFQYYLILRFFGFSVPLLIAFAGIATIFLVQTSIPLPLVMGLLMRGEVALTIWGYSTDNDLGILASTFLLFIINLSLPALLGLGIIVRTNVIKSLGYEK